MLAMAMTEPRSGGVVALDLDRPVPGPTQILVRVLACGVCRTDLHVVDGDLSSPKLPIVPGHEIVGRVEQVGAGVEEFEIGERVGIPWLGYSCGVCEFCRSGRENLCRDARYTGTRSTVATPSTQWPTRDSVSGFLIPTTTSMRRRSCALA